MFQLAANDWAVVIAVISGGLFIWAILQYGSRLVRNFTHEPVIFPTQDGKTIAGDYYAGKKKEAVVLVHMIPADKESWSEICPKIQALGLHVLAIDLRGHGGSTGGPSGYKGFSDTEHQSSLLDLEAAASFLNNRGIPPSGLTFIGASFGANLALMYAVSHRETQAVALLSPGLNYRGIQAGPLVRELWAGQRIFFASSEDDDRAGGNNADGTRVIFEAVPKDCFKEIMIYKFAGHGTEMFGKEIPPLENEIIRWLKGEPQKKSESNT